MTRKLTAAAPRFPLFFLALLLLLPGLNPASRAQTPASAGVQVSGAGLAQPAQLSPAQLAKLPRLQVMRPDHDGKKRTYSGVALYAVLTAAGAKLGADLPRKGMAHYVQASAADGYQAVFALAELDPAFATRTVLLADRCDGQPLPATAGPYQIIVPDEKKMGRCVRQVQALRLVAAQP
ncbi:molybdopterin-dependent oxidoreductase [Hymenobacter sp. DH14]|uniref:Molybdopterin-dependent oxidoreductase n=1 Tax=Hymenobacter cyanobacteriorum TaxID=2926463 RepID=A0A9X2AHY6_9BACT|nr:molybdopterin-dependent oxidoreductase [Hymenobacter cyanobacteriorum]MCI1189398.1 molybdopterin-dependent oxidoreductase [Hymenobacter cyanobacteriorum]